jgi:hypothetical protein
MRDLFALSESNFDVLLAADNVLLYLLTQPDLARVVQQIAGNLQSKGLFLAVTRDYDETAEQRPAVPSPVFFRHGAGSRALPSGCDRDKWSTVHGVYLKWETDAGSDSRYSCLIYRALPRV